MQNAVEYTGLLHSNQDKSPRVLNLLFFLKVSKYTIYSITTH